MPTLDSYLTDTLMRDLVGHDRRPVSFLVYLWLSIEQQRKEEAIQISYQELAECVGVSKSSVQSAVGWLIRRRLLAATKQNVTATPRYQVLRPWADRSRRRSTPGV
jgi:predicted regulator of amino acid metabolism with ACT domain